MHSRLTNTPIILRCFEITWTGTTSLFFLENETPFAGLGIELLPFKGSPSSDRVLLKLLWRHLAVLTVHRPLSQGYITKRFDFTPSLCLPGQILILKKNPLALKRAKEIRRNITRDVGYHQV